MNPRFVIYPLCTLSMAFGFFIGLRLPEFVARIQTSHDLTFPLITGMMVIVVILSEMFLSIRSNNPNP